MHHSMFYVPIENIVFTPEFPKSLSINRVTFIPAKPFLAKPGNFGFPKSELSKFEKVHEIIWEHVDAIAVVKLDKPQSYNYLINIINAEMEILVGSIVGWKSRSSAITPRIQGINCNRQTHFFTIKDHKVSFGFTRERLFGDLDLNYYWKKWVYDYYFRFFLKNLDCYNYKWRTLLKRVLQLCGKSQMTIFNNEAFLYNMIALETLLLDQNDQFKNRIQNSLYAFLGWTSLWYNSNSIKIIENIYKKRCALVHEGESINITLDDIIFTDGLIRNILINIILHPKLFTKKQDIRTFVSKREAERILGYSKSRIFPRTFKAMGISSGAKEGEVLRL
jgi:hypothetical protein